MSRTVKWEHTSDPVRTCYRLERQARPAGRIVRILEADAAEMCDVNLEDKFPTCFIPQEAEVDMSDWGPFCYVCNRCTDHFAEHCDLVELGLCYYREDGSVMLTEAGRRWLADEAYGRR
jgi:hypothetical protein